MALIGCFSSAFSLPRISKSFLTFLLLSLACLSSSLESFVAQSLPAPYQPQPGQLAELLSLLYFLPRLVLQPPVTLLLELQALTWERIVVTAVTGEGGLSPSLLLQVLPLVLVLAVLVREWRLLSWSQLLLCCSCLLLAGGGQTVSPPAWPSPVTRPVSSLTWSEYSQVCPPGSSAGLNTGGEAVTCRHFTGLGVQWSGQVTGIEMRERTNTVETFLNMIPDNIRVWTNVDCVLGER